HGSVDTPGSGGASAGTSSGSVAGQGGGGERGEMWGGGGTPPPSGPATGGERAPFFPGLFSVDARGGRPRRGLLGATRARGTLGTIARTRSTSSSRTRRVRCR